METFKNGKLMTIGKVFTFILAVSSLAIAFGRFYDGPKAEITILKWIGVMATFLFVMQIISYLSISYILTKDSFVIKIGPVERKISYEDIISVELLKNGIKLKMTEELGVVSLNCNKNEKLFSELTERMKQRKIEMKNKEEEMKEKMQLRAVLSNKSKNK